MSLCSHQHSGCITCFYTSHRNTSDLGWYPETTFEVGIVKTIDWYLANTEWMERVTSGEYQKYYEEMYKDIRLLEVVAGQVKI